MAFNRTAGCGLHEVWTKRPYVQVVEDYILGHTRPYSEDDGLPVSSSEDRSVDFVEELELTSYRGFPRGTSFQFGKANLLSGPNGTGKTSILEAVELVLCGATFRNQGENEEGASVFLRIKDRPDPLEYTPGRNKLFQARDLQWYGNAYGYGNLLPLSFNRFNFFDSDASYRLMNSSDPSVIAQAISSLFIGERANWIDERVHGFVERFQEQRRAYDKEIAAHRQAIKDAEAELAALEQTPDLSEVSASLVRSAKECKWRLGLPSMQINEIVRVESTLDQLVTTVQACTASLGWIPKLSIGKMQADRQLITADISKAGRTSAQLEECKRESLELGRELKTIEVFISKMSELELFVCHPELQKLLDLSSALTSKRQHEQRLCQVLEMVADYSLGTFASSEATIEEMKQRNSVQHQRLVARRNELASKINSLRRQIDESSRLVTEILAKAQELLSMDPDIDSCPLCHRKYALGELAQRIEQHSSSSPLQDALCQHMQELSELDGKVNGLASRLRELDTIARAIEILGQSTQSPEALSRSVARLRAVTAALDTTRNDIASLLALKQQFANVGLTEQKYLDLIAWFDARQRVLQVERDTDRLRSQKERLVKQSGKIGLDLEELGKRQQDLECQITSMSPDNLQRRLHALDQGIDLIRQCAQHLDISEDEDLTILLRRLTELGLTLGRCRSMLEESTKTDAIRMRRRQQIRQSTTKLASLNQAHDRITQALEVLLDIQNNRSKEHHLSESVRYYSDMVLRVFQSIHHPKEFSDIKLTGDSISLVRAGSGRQSVPLTRISTGQRSALALSTFLGLNWHLVQGPPYVILDDPIAHVDDLNTLSFLDHLRDRIIRGDRQLFFATASHKMANLFARKFEFLGDEFKLIELH